MKRTGSLWKLYDSFVLICNNSDDLTNEQKDAIAAVLINQKYYKNQNIVTEGDPGSAFYIIKEVFLGNNLGNSNSMES